MGRMKRSASLFEADAVDLPEIEVIGLKAAEGLLEHLGGEGGVAAVGADLGHKEDLVAAAFETFA